MKLCSDGEHDRGDSPVHACQVRNPQRGRAQPDQAGRQAGQAQVGSLIREIIFRHRAIVWFEKFENKCSEMSFSKSTQAVVG